MMATFFFGGGLVLVTYGKRIIQRFFWGDVFIQKWMACTIFFNGGWLVSVTYGNWLRILFNFFGWVIFFDYKGLSFNQDILRKLVFY